MKNEKLYIWLFVFVVLSPLGILATGSAWGEWTSGKVAKDMGFLPKGMKALEGTWSTFMADYTIVGLSGNFILNALGYILTAIIGIGLIFIIFKLASYLLPE